MTGGWENEVYAFDLLRIGSENSRSEPLILRVYPGDYADVKSLREFEAMQKLQRMGYPVPHVHLREALESPIGKPFIIMDRVEGRFIVCTDL